MSAWPVGLSTGCFYRTSILEVLESIRSSGFCLIEVCSFPDHLNYHDEAKVEKTRSLLRKLGLECYSFHAPFHQGIDITSLDPEKRRCSIEEIFFAATAAARLGVQHFVIHPGPDKEKFSAGPNYPQLMENASQALKQVAEHCASLGMKLVLENVLPHLLFGDSLDMLRILSALAPDRAGACLDTGHANLARESASMVRHLAARLVMLHANDNDGREDDHKPPGQGLLDWVALVRALKEVKFNGTLILELSGEEKANPFLALEKAMAGRDYLLRVMNSSE